MAEIIEPVDWMIVSQERPHYGRDQVRSLRGIKPGRYYLEMGKLTGSMKNYKYGITGTVVKITSLVNTSTTTETENGVEHSTDSSLCIVPGVHGLEIWHSLDRFLADTSIIAYTDGTWNSTRFLLRTRAKTPEDALRSLEKKTVESEPIIP